MICFYHVELIDWNLSVMLNGYILKTGIGLVEMVVWLWLLCECHNVQGISLKFVVRRQRKIAVISLGKFQGQFRSICDENKEEIKPFLGLINCCNTSSSVELIKLNSACLNTNYDYSKLYSKLISNHACCTLISYLYCVCRDTQQGVKSWVWKIW